MTKREFLDTVFALAPNEANAIMDAFDEYVESNEPHWIPVTEDTLPKENRVVVVCGDKGTWDFGTYRGHGDDIHFLALEKEHIQVCLLVDVQRRCTPRTLQGGDGMSKYIIELEDDIKYLIINGRADNRYYTLVRRVADLEELNSDYINEHFGSLQDTAYQKGLEDGKKAFDLLDAERDSEYQRGLNDAWEAAKKIALMDTETSENVTGYFGLFRIMENLTPMQAIEKLKAYEEQKADDEIKVGDEVIDIQSGARFGVTHFWKSNHGDKGVSGFNRECSAFQVTIDKVKKTGRHYNIDKILEEMKE